VFALFKTNLFSDFKECEYALFGMVWYVRFWMVALSPMGGLS
jgi:hypothetical protein